MENSAAVLSGIERLRLTVAVNHFKRLVLGDKHVPGKSQALTLFDALASKLSDKDLTPRTWENWFSNTKLPSKTTMSQIDRLTASIEGIGSEDCSRKMEADTGPYSNLIRGGLLSCLKTRSKSKHPIEALIYRANQYQPYSPLHLHLDAIEISAISEGHGPFTWDVLRQIGAGRILTLLAKRWRPRYGTIFRELKSDLRLEWEAADETRRLEIEAQCNRFKPSMFQGMLNAPATPDWSVTGIDYDVFPQHSYKLLFALAADSNFLRADRMEAWALDLSTAALAMHAMAWTDRYETFGCSPIADELIYWIAFDEILFCSEALDEDNTEIIRAMSRLNAEWTHDAFGVFHKARETYHCQLAELGISSGEVRDTAMQATVAHPLVYRA